LRWLFIVILTVGYPFGIISLASVFWNKRRQTWHDRAAGTLVLQVSERVRTSDREVAAT
jgi:uncharacterized RDD family membrane protein YckC